MALSELINETLKTVAGEIFTVEKLNNPAKEFLRYNTCQKRCDRYDAKNDKCKECGCFMSVKTKLFTNRNLKKLRIEQTHCPLGKWGDIEVANKYREIDGKPLIEN